MTTDQYASAKKFFGNAPNYVVSNDDKDRLRAYDLYEDIYWGSPDTFKLVERGDNEIPIYLPSAKKIIEATNRFLAVDFDFLVQEGSDAVKQYWENLFKRERVRTKFATQRRYGLIRGDALWHITANPNKPAGSRLSVHELDPRYYFPITDIYDDTNILGCHIIQPIQDPRTPDDATKIVMRRQTYRKASAVKLPGGGYTVSENVPASTAPAPADDRKSPEDFGETREPITSELAAFEIDKWDDRFLKPGDLKQIAWAGTIPERPLENIFVIPVYHVPNGRMPGSVFGCSQIRGIETVISAANQAISDEDLTLAMQGLGVYWTSAGPPLDTQGNETAWNIGPGEVAEVPAGEQFGRVSGVSSVAPFLEHINFILGEAQLGAGVPDIAMGKVDVTVAESGISLRLQLAPILSANSEKEQEMISTYDQMFYDICTMWLPEYEDLAEAADAVVVAVFGDPLPVNRTAKLQEIIDMVTSTPPLMTIRQAVIELGKLGFDFTPADVTELTEAAKSARAAGTPDPFGNRLQNESGGANGGPGSGDDEPSAAGGE